ncbi:MAG: 2OG-Fe(II) oxygenase [Rhodospirillales bacterium]
MAWRESVGETVARAVTAAERRDTPFRHWLLTDILPPGMGAAFSALPIPPPPIEDTRGKRDTNNSTRSYADRDNRARFPVCDDLAQALQRGPAVAAIERVCGVDLAGTNLRIEYCQDTDGFWLEPHTDIGVKKLTFLIYLSEGPGSERWGTDLMTPGGEVLGTAPYRRNAGLMFVPGGDTWHGFRRRPIAGVRRSLIVNYVGPEWRARRELAFPDLEVGGPG